MITTTTVSNITRHVYIYGYIESPAEFEEELAKWDTDWNYPNETVVLHINSSGGSVASMNSLILRLNKVRKLYTIAEGDCASAALYLYLMGDLRAANKYTIFMAHNFMVSHGASSETINNAKEYADYSAKQAYKMLDSFFIKPKYLTKREVNELLNGKEMYFNYKEAAERGMINCDLDDFPIK